MSNDGWILAIAWFITGFIMLFAINRMERNISKERDKMYDERIAWKNERQQLLDRIQAPSYDHLKHHEVKIIKAHNNEKEPPKLEQL